MVRRLTVLFVVLLSSVLLVGVTQAAPAFAAEFKLAPSTWSPMMQIGNIGNKCRYRVYYSSYGDQPFAWVRLYQGEDCARVGVSIRAQNGGIVQYTPDDGQYTGGVDSCGSYYQLQASSRLRPAYGVGALVTHPAEWHEFRHNAGSNLPPSGC